MSDTLVVQSHKGPYSVFFDNTVIADHARLRSSDPHFLVDANVARLYETSLRDILEDSRTIIIDATEENKALDNLVPVFDRLVRDRFRRDHSLVAIGGGIVQDITCFAASTLLRGVPWRFVPTTLLAQADSCIGSKSSINLGTAKNILGTFYPPTDIFVDTGFLNTLAAKDIWSGIGEILKVHAIEGRDAFDRIAADFDRLTTDRNVLLRYVRAALDIKRRFIEEDEFDRGVRNVFNYGHSFGHAIESATGYAIPHGVAVAMGMDMANWIASARGLVRSEHYRRMHPVLRKTYDEFATTTIPSESMIAALMKDKKNTSTMLGLILPVGPDARIQRVGLPPDALFMEQCAEFLSGLAA